MCAENSYYLLERRDESYFKCTYNCPSLLSSIAVLSVSFSHSPTTYLIGSAEVVWYFNTYLYYEKGPLNLDSAL